MLFDLVDLYTDRRRREMYENGVAAALAAHDPSSLGDLNKQPERAAQTDGDIPGQWWEPVDGDRT